jgi:hypothetical protein
LLCWVTWPAGGRRCWCGVPPRWLAHPKP